MEVGGVTETLSVSGEAPLFDVTTAEVGGHITAEELNDLPSATRNYMAFVGNVPGGSSSPAPIPERHLSGQRTAVGRQQLVFDGANNTDDLRGSNVGGQARAANESLRKCRSSPTSSTRSRDALLVRSSTP